MMHQPKKRILWLSAIIIVSIAVAWLIAGMGDSTLSKGTNKNYVIHALRFSPKGTVLHVSRGILDDFAKPCEIVEYWQADSWGVAFRSQPNILTRVPCAMTVSDKTKCLVTLTVRAGEWKRGTALFYPFFGLVSPAFAVPNAYGGMI